MQAFDNDRACAARRPRKFTVILPIVRPPFFLRQSVRSVLDQTLANLELCIICDGAPPETVAMAHDLARIDDRIFVFSFEKGERYGEAYRDIILKGANSEFVAQIGDDDLWYPDHLAVLAELLRTVDLAALLQVRLMPGGAVSPVPRFEVLSEPAIRHKMLSEPWNFFGPSEAGYRLQAYRALPVGWSPAPLDLWTDLFMWRKFLRHPGLTYASRWAVTSLKFGADDWQGIEPEELAGIIASEAARLRDPLRRAEIGIRKRLVSAAPGSLDAAQMVSGRRSKGISSPMRLLEWLAMSLRRVRSQP